MNPPAPVAASAAPLRPNPRSPAHSSNPTSPARAETPRSARYLPPRSSRPASSAPSSPAHYQSAPDHPQSNPPAIPPHPARPPPYARSSLAAQSIPANPSAADTAPPPRSSLSPYKSADSKAATPSSAPESRYLMDSQHNPPAAPETAIQIHRHSAPPPLSRCQTSQNFAVHQTHPPAPRSPHRH